MSRAGILFLICAILAGTYLFVRFQKSGEVLQIGWRKRTANTNVDERSTGIGQTEFRFVRVTNNEIDTAETVEGSSAPVETPKKSANAAELVAPTETLGIRPPPSQKHFMYVPTNAVWNAKPRSGPGVRIAFP